MQITKSKSGIFRISDLCGSTVIIDKELKDLKVDFHNTGIYVVCTGGLFICGSGDSQKTFKDLEVALWEAIFKINEEKRVKTSSSEQALMVVTIVAIWNATTGNKKFIEKLKNDT